MLKLPPEYIRNVQVANSVFRLLSETSSCIIFPHEINNYSKLVFCFPETADEDFLNFILDCLELITKEPAEFSQPSDITLRTGFCLCITNKEIITDILNTDTTCNVYKHLNDFILNYKD